VSITHSDIQVYSQSRALENSINFSDFRCENDQLTNYLLNTAQKDENENIGKIFLFVYNKKVIGFITLAMSQLGRFEHQRLSNLTTTRDYVPGLLVGHIARHIKYKGKGIGTIMRDWIIKQALFLAKYTGCRIIILQAFDDNIVEIYKKWGFISVNDFEESGRRKMFIDLAWLENN
jgi:hypothetical protein